MHGISAADVHGAQPRPWQPARSDAEYAAYNTVRRPGRAVLRSPGASGQRTGRHRRGPVRRTAGSPGVSQAAAKSRPRPCPERCRSLRPGPHDPVPPAVPARPPARRRSRGGSSGAAGRSRGRRREGPSARGAVGPGSSRRTSPGGRQRPAGWPAWGQVAGRGRGGRITAAGSRGRITRAGPSVGARRRDRGGAARGAEEAGARRREGGARGTGALGVPGAGARRCGTVSPGRAGPPDRSGSPGTPPGSLLPRSLLVPECGRARSPHSPRPVLSSA